MIKRWMQWVGAVQKWGGPRRTSDENIVLAVRTLVDTCRQGFYFARRI